MTKIEKELKCRQSDFNYKKMSEKNEKLVEKPFLLQDCSSLEELADRLTTIGKPEDDLVRVQRARVLLNTIESIDNFSDSASIDRLISLLGVYVAAASGSEKSALVAYYAEFCDLLDENIQEPAEVLEVRVGVMEQVIDICPLKISPATAARAYANVSAK